MLDAVYVDSKENMIVAIKPKAPFKPVFEIATTKEDSEVALVHDPEAEPRIADQPPPHGHGLEADSCLWWRRGRVGTLLFARGHHRSAASNGRRWTWSLRRVEVAPSILAMGLYPVTLRTPVGR